MKILSIVLLLATAGAAVQAAPPPANVARHAPNFTWEGIPNASTLQSVKGQAVVLLIARSPREGTFRKQAKNLQKIYSEFASRGVIFAAAFTEEDHGVVRSNIPFVVVKNPAQVASEYGAGRGFTMVIIGRDGNLDYETGKVLPSSRVRDVIQNSYDVQANERKAI